MKMIKLPNALIVVGTNRNAGKTTLACEIINRFSARQKLIGIKISPHFHELEQTDIIVEKNDDFVIVKESRQGEIKDSCRMLRAGAHEVYYIQVWDRNIDKAFNCLSTHIDGSLPLVCESGWLRTIVEPGGFIILNRKGNTDFKQSIEDYKKLPHTWMEFNGKNFDPDPKEIILENNHWVYNGHSG
jgi:hypothetical protein